MANTLQTSINWVLPFIKYDPAITAGVGNEPSISNANLIRQIMQSAPLTWPETRNETTFVTTAPSGSPLVGVQDYTKAIGDFGFLEKVSLTNAAGKIWEIKDVFNTAALGVSAELQRPSAIAVKSNDGAGSIGFRFMGVPDAVYTVTLTYQKSAVLFAALGDAWTPIPDKYSDIYNQLFLALSFDAVDGESQRATQYWNRGIAMLLSKAEGLTEMQKNIFLTQWLRNDNQALAAQMRTQQGNQARAQG